MKSKNVTDWNFSFISKNQKFQAIQHMNSNMYPNTSFDVSICLVYFNFFSKKYFSIMIIGDLYESLQNQLSIQICMKKIMLPILKHQILPFWPTFCLKYIRRQEKQISEIWFFQSIVKCHHAKHQNNSDQLLKQFQILAQICVIDSKNLILPPFKTYSEMPSSKNQENPLSSSLEKNTYVT